MFIGIIVDSVICVILVFLYKSLNVSGKLENTLVFLGKHSMNIFLFHTFIFSYYFHDFIYCSHNPIIIYITLLVVCLIISVAINNFKEIIRWDSFITQLTYLGIK